MKVVECLAHPPREVDFFHGNRVVNFLSYFEVTNLCYFSGFKFDLVGFVVALDQLLLRQQQE